jgi:hypothetical protein
MHGLIGNHFNHTNPAKLFTPENLRIRQVL